MRQHNRVRRGGGRYSWKGWLINTARWLSPEKEGGQKKVIRCDPFYYSTYGAFAADRRRVQALVILQSYCSQVTLSASW